MAEIKQQKFFPSQRESEEIFLLLRKHWFSYVPFVLLTLVMVAPILIILSYWANNFDQVSDTLGNIIVIFTSMYSLFILSLLLYGFVDYYLDVNLVTNQRIIDIEQNGFFRRKIAELSLDQIEDVTADVSGAFRTLLHYGDIHIQTAGTKPNFLFDAVPHPYRISKTILDLHDAQQNKTSAKRAAAVKNVQDDLARPESGDGLEMQSVTMVRKLQDKPEQMRVVPKQVQKQIFAGIKTDKRLAEESGRVVLEGEIKEGETVKL